MVDDPPDFWHYLHMDTQPRKPGRPPTWPLRSQVDAFLESLTNKKMTIGKALEKAGITRRQLDRLRDSDPWFDYRVRRLMRRFHHQRLMGGDVDTLAVIELEADIIPSEWMQDWAEVQAVINAHKSIANAMPEARERPTLIPPAEPGSLEENF